MKFEHELIPATLIKRYKRFLADVKLSDGTLVTAHCANSGSMMGLGEEGNPVWLSPAANPKAKLDYKWELVEVNGTMVGINTSRPNYIVEEAILAGHIKELSGYEKLRREMKYGERSRIDLFLSEGSAADCYVEVKSVTLSRNTGGAEFPDAVTARGTKHLRELGHMVEQGFRAVMVYLVQREDCVNFSLARDIDPAYAEAFEKARKSGVEMLCYGCKINLKEIYVNQALPIVDI